MKFKFAEHQQQAAVINHTRLPTGHSLQSPMFRLLARFYTHMLWALEVGGGDEEHAAFLMSNPARSSDS